MTSSNMAKYFTKWMLLSCLLQAPLFFAQESTELNVPDDLIVSIFNSTEVYDEETTEEECLEDTCVCLPFIQCYNGKVNKGGVDIVGFRFGQPNCGNLELCCKVPKLKNGTQPCLTQSSIPVQLSNPTWSTASLINQVDNASLEETSQDCGIRHISGVGFRVKGPSYKAQFGEFPWMVAVLKENITSSGTRKLIYNCGGSLIHPKVVLTTAHNVDKTEGKNLWVRAGEWDLESILERIPHQTRRVSKKILHKGYVPTTGYYDIALLLLEEPFGLSSHINIACLPRPNVVVSHEECIISGWGADSMESDILFQRVLKQTTVPMVPRNACESALKETRLGNYFELHKTFVCAGGEEADACLGDGGSPLVCPIKDGKALQFEQVGIVSWGIGCGTSAPGVYVHVAYFVPWINKIMDSLGLTPQYHNW